MPGPEYRDDLDVPRLPIGGDRCKQIALYRRKIRSAIAGKGSLTDQMYSGLAFLYEMENEPEAAIRILEEGLQWFPESQLLILVLLRLLVLDGTRSNQIIEKTKLLMEKLLPGRFQGPEKACFDSFHFCLEKRKKEADFTELLALSNHIQTSLQDVDPARLRYGGGWKLDFPPFKSG